jgi:serine/threonine protein phosphatase PrpC
LKERLLACVDKITAHLNVDPRFLYSGTTLCCVVFYDQVFYAVNVGDSKFELIDFEGGTLFETVEHKAETRVAGILAVSRALGDFACLKDDRFSATPDYYEFAAPTIPFAALLSTDGFTDIYESGGKQILHKFLCQFPNYVPTIAAWDSNAKLRESVNVVQYLDAFKNAALCPNAAVAALSLAESFGGRDNTSVIFNSAFSTLNARAPTFEPVFGFVDSGFLKATDEKGVENGQEYPLRKTALTGFVKGIFTKGAVANLEQVVFEGIVRCLNKEQGFIFVGSGKWEDNVYCRPTKQQMAKLELNTMVRYTKFLTARTKQIRALII